MAATTLRRDNVVNPTHGSLYFLERPDTQEAEWAQGYREKKYLHSSVTRIKSAFTSLQLCALLLEPPIVLSHSREVSRSSHCFSLYAHSDPLSTPWSSAVVLLKHHSGEMGEGESDNNLLFLICFALTLLDNFQLIHERRPFKICNRLFEFIKINTK